MEVSILFMAHDGIAHPDVWQHWANCSSFKINFAAYTEVIGYEQWDLRLKFKTGWGQVSTVQAEVAAFEKILDIFPNTSLIVSVSGVDLPLCNPDSLLTYSLNKVYMGKTPCIPAFRQFLKRRFKCSPVMHCAHFAIPVYFAQWLVTAMKSDENTELINLARKMEPAARDKLHQSYEVNADEWLLGTLLATRFGESIIDETRITESVFQDRFQSSPITFKDFDQNFTSHFTGYVLRHSRRSITESLIDLLHSPSDFIRKVQLNPQDVPRLIFILRARWLKLPR